MSTSYRPSNGSEGADFMVRWCGHCRNDGDNGCAIAAATMIFQVKDAEYPSEWRQDGPSGPRCTAFASIDGAEPLDPAAAIGSLL